MIRLIALTTLIIGAVAIVGINAYLSPNDLKACNEQPTGEENCQKVDAIVAVSGGKTAARTAEAITLYQQGWADYIIFSGDAFDENSPSNASVMRKQALAAGIANDAIITEELSRTTHQNAEKTSQLLEEKNVRSLIVVTSPYHQRRAGLEFKQFAGEKIRVLNHPVKDDPDWPWYWWVTPRGWWLAVGEMVKIGAANAGESQ